MREIDPHNPIDKIAARVVSKVNHIQTEFNPGDKIFSMSPLPTRQFTGPKKDDLSGTKCGRYTVIGCATFMPRNHFKQSNSVRWVVKCACGRYGMLTTKGVKKNSPYTMCTECKKTSTRRNNSSGYFIA